MLRRRSDLLTRSSTFLLSIHSLYEAKRVDVYSFRLLTKRGDKTDLGRAECIYNHVQDFSRLRCYPDETRKKAKRQALGFRSAEKGVASFIENAKIQKFEMPGFERKFSVRTGILIGPERVRLPNPRPILYPKTHQLMTRLYWKRLAVRDGTF